MREIKFRAWDSIENKMIYGVTIFPNRKTKICRSKGFDLQYDPVYDDVDVMQLSTGLHDKNGEEIYEGDILDVDGEYFNLTPKRTEDRYYSVWFGSDKVSFHIGNLLDNIIPRNDLSQKYYKIIGNIYENHELLENK